MSGCGGGGGMSLGVEYGSAPELASCMVEMAESKFQFALVPVLHARLRRVAGPHAPPDLTRSDMVLGAGDWSVRAVGKLSPHLDVEGGAGGARCRARHEAALREELAYCRGLGVAAVQLRLHASAPRPVNLARILHNYFHDSYTPNQVWVRVPMVSEHLVNNSDDVDECEEAYEAPWRLWSVFHELMEWNKYVGVLLELTADLPPEHVIQRWLGEPVKAVVVPTYLFNTNKKGYPVLPRAHQDVLMRFVEQDAQVVVSGARRCPLQQYTAYLTHLWSRQPDRSQDRIHAYAKGWEDFLQTPLQPLADNLETSTYSVFESDPVKYEQYQNAITLALLELKRRELEKEDVPSSCTNGPINPAEMDKGDDQYTPEKCDPLKCDKGITDEPLPTRPVNTGSRVKPNIPNTEKDIHNDEDQQNELEDRNNKENIKSPAFKKVFRLMILGAGRGPLIRAAFNAADICQINIQLVAIEKNPCALVSLVAQAREMWAGRDIEIVPGDMRKRSIAPADIIVSELLGSWGDNELSPECLDGAARLLKRGGISIPSWYTSYVAPVSTARLWASAKTVNSVLGKKADKNLENIWVVYMKNKHHIADTKPVFTFTHPSKTGEDEYGETEDYYDPDTQMAPDNRRYACLSWVAEQAGVMHGFSGNFDCELYGGEHISIEPSSHSPGMTSWFPVFIPIRTPLRFEKGEEIKVMFWRCVDERKVWYEWIASVGDKSTPLHNINGRNFKMLL